MEQEFYLYEDFNVGAELLAVLAERGVLTESQARNINTKSEILMESRGGTPTMYVISPKDQEHTIPWELFKTVYTDYSTYPTKDDMIKALGLNPYTDFSPDPENVPNERERERRRNDRIYQALAGAVKHFNDAGVGNLLSIGKRENYSRDRLNQMDEEEYRRKINPEFDPKQPWLAPPSYDDIKPGSRQRKNGRDSKIIDQINDQEDLLKGELYNDRTRIPKQKWGHWLKFWEREISSVKNKRFLLGRTWKKMFILGYQIERNVLFEIWFNSFNSSFIIHDMQGNQVSRSYQTMNEALKQMFNTIAKTSPDDAGFFHNANNPLSQSFVRSIFKGTDDKVEDLKRLEQREIKQKKKEEKELQDEMEKKKKEREKAKAERDTGGWDKIAKQNTKQVDNEIENHFEKAARERREKRERKKEEKKSKRAEEQERKNQEYKEFNKNLEDDPVFQASEHRRRNRQHDATRKSRDDMDERQKQKQEEKEEEEELERYREELAAKKAKNKEDLKKAQDEGRHVGRDAQNARVDDEENERQFNLFNENESMDDFVDKMLDGESEGEKAERAIEDKVDNSSYEAIVKQLRQQAENSSYTKSLFKSKVVEDSIEAYYETRAHKNFFDNRFLRWISNGRRDKIILPFDKPIFKRVKNALLGTRYRADFIIGFTYNDLVDFEVWYITEPNPNKNWTADDNVPDTISTFYVFDVTSGMLIRKYIPYYRNAIQNIMAKMAAY